ncbi:MAG TPA: hypothetical protein VFW15_08365 [Thermoanaerobaculia bacterium]|nr:hypothetical protein [Thermoanaerobaculia bacterium]
MTERPRKALGLALAVATAVLAACASSSKDPFLGSKSVDATVVERQYDPPGTGGASYAGTGNYYLVFEGKEGEATAHYRFRVTRQQYLRFGEGSHVQLVIVDGNLRDIRPLQ